MNITKRNGSFEAFDLDKIHRVLEWACKDITGVSISEIELKANIQLYDKIPAYEIHELLIKSAGDLISENTPNYQFVAARLINYKLRKEIYGQYKPFTLEKIIKKNVNNKVYDKDLITKYTKEDYSILNDAINHDRDMLFTYVGMEQFRGKYLCQNRVTKEIFETPQILYMCLCMTLFINEDKENRLKKVIDYYNLVSTFQISLPTPIMAGVRTPVKQFASCVLIDCDDSLDSICATTSAITKYISKRAGIGINGGSIRAVGSQVGPTGTIKHTGVTPYYKLFESAVKSSSQGGTRGGAATLNFPWWHYEVEDIIVLKNSKGTEDNRVRKIDYVIQLNKFLYQKILDEEDICLFSPHDVKDLYNAFYINQNKFEELYNNYSKDKNIRKKIISAKKLFFDIIRERVETGRLYIMNVDHCNTHSPFKVPVKMTNLCTEILEYVKPLNDLHDKNGEIATCILSAQNWGLINEPNDFKKLAYSTVVALDNLIDYQEYPVYAAKNFTLNRRSLGIGIINFAYFLAKRDLKYNINAAKIVHEYAEAWSYYNILASIQLAKERGPCNYYHETKWYNGIIPIDTYKKDVDYLVSPVYKMDWDYLREQLKKYGIRNSTLMACMPADTSALISNSTNGIDPPKGLVISKQSKNGIQNQVVPGITYYKNKYDLLWDQQGPKGYLTLMAVLQKFMDQAISVNTSYNLGHYKDNKIPGSIIAEDILFHYKYGGKTLYYNNTFDMSGEEKYEEECESCKI